MDINEFTRKIPTFVEQAVDTGNRLSVGETELSPSLASIDALDKTIEYFHSLWLKDLLDNKLAWNISVSFGVLLGEMIIDKHHYHWIIKDTLPVVETDDGNRLSPITKIYKIITDEDSYAGSPSGFYNGFLALQKYQNMSDEVKEQFTIYVDNQEDDS